MRRSLEQYNLFDPRMFVHVVNVSFQKKHRRYKELEHDVHWTMEEFEDYLINYKIADREMIKKLYRRMAAIITYTYETILDELKKDRAGTYQLFGYDFMFD